MTTPDKNITLNTGKMLKKCVVLRVKMIGVRRVHWRLTLTRWLVTLAGIVGGFKRAECTFDVELK